MAFPSLTAQQETNRKILEDLQIKKQLLQRGVSPVAPTITGISSLPNACLNQPVNHLQTQPSEFSQISSTSRPVFLPANTTTFGFFIPQDSFYGNTFLPVIPRLDPPPTNQSNFYLIMACMKLKKLEGYLQNVEGFKNPKVELEQYKTPPHIASCVIHYIQDKFGDIDGKLVGDLGSGCGILSIASALLGAQLTVGFEIDKQAVQTFLSNVSEMDIASVDCVQCDVLSLSNSKWRNAFDTIIMNPPFGTKSTNMGLDIRFVEIGIDIANTSVYSFHKTSTRKYIAQKAKEWKVKGEIVAELKYNIEQCYKFHKHKSVDIQVDFWRFDVS